ncbi:MAG TPA: GAF domain-containing protein, partial [Allocoleopsis sp.]
RESLDLDTIFQKTAIEVRHLLNADRVGVFRFYPESGWQDGEFVSEDVLPGFASALHAKVHDHCFGEQYAVHYQQGKIQAVDDVYAAGLQACHVSLLSQFQIRANLVVPLRQSDHLWGLLCIHQCEAPRQWQPDEIEFASQVAIHLGIAIQQAELLAQTQQQSVELAQALQELKRSHSHLIQSEKMSSLGQLVAGVAHEINNPVNFIYGNLAHASQYAEDLLEVLSLYQQEYPNPGADLQSRISELDLDFLMEDFPKILSSMQVGADRIRQIVLSLRNFSRLDEAEMKPVNIHEGLDSTLLILQHRLKPRPDSAGIQVVKDYGDLPLVECYASQLNQVFMNILSNAIDALEEFQEQQQDRNNHRDLSKPWQQISIRTELLTDSQIQVPLAVIRMKDNGGGITAAARAKLFDPFFTTKPVGKGTGLGLSISHQIVVERHGGTLECYSRPGEGTEFCIAIPVRQIVPRQEMSLTCTIDP